MKTLRIGIASYDRMKQRSMAIARGEHNSAGGEPTVWFTSIESFAKVLSGRNRELLATIAREQPGFPHGAREAGRTQQVELVADAEDHVALRTGRADGGTARYTRAAGSLRSGEARRRADLHLSPPDVIGRGRAACKASHGRRAWMIGAVGGAHGVANRTSYRWIWFASKGSRAHPTGNQRAADFTRAARRRADASSSRLRSRIDVGVTSRSSSSAR